MRTNPQFPPDFFTFTKEILKGTVIRIEEALIDHRLRVSKVSRKFRIPFIYNFAVIYP